MEKIKIALRETPRGYQFISKLEEKETFYGKRRYSSGTDVYIKRLPLAIKKLKEFYSKVYKPECLDFVGIVAQDTYYGEEV